MRHFPFQECVQPQDMMTNQALLQDTREPQNIKCGQQAVWCHSGLCGIHFRKLILQFGKPPFRKFPI